MIEDKPMPIYWTLDPMTWTSCEKLIPLSPSTPLEPDSVSLPLLVDETVTQPDSDSYDSDVSILSDHSSSHCRGKVLCCRLCAMASFLLLVAAALTLFWAFAVGFGHNPNQLHAHGFDFLNQKNTPLSSRLQVQMQRNQDQCDLPIISRIDCHPESAATQDECLARGCCWNPLLAAFARGVPWCFFPSGQCTIDDIKRIDCFPEPGASEQKCLQRNCCWRQSSNSGVPMCYYGTDLSGRYTGSAPRPTPTGYTAALTLQKGSHWPRDISSLKLDVRIETGQRLHFKITDSQAQRWEVPLETPEVDRKAVSPDYDVIYVQNPFSITVVRKSTGAKLFDTTGTPLTFSDQFIELSTKLPSKFVYGLGESRGRFLKDVRKGQKLSFWTRDIPPREDFNLYGVHPFYLGMENDGNAYGVFLLNSNAMDVILAPDQTLTYRTIGGVLDFWVFLGPTPDAVIGQYSDVIGRPAMPPFWSLGFHLCRWGYNNVTDMEKVINRMRAAEIPYDTQWNDIDYMDNKYDWTIDPKNFAALPSLVDSLHKNHMRYMMIIDAGIPNVNGYASFDDGVEMDVFIKKADGSGPIIGQVWPGTTAFPDYSHPNASAYWYKQAKRLHDQLNFDGIWIDMNEPSNFFTGSEEGCPGNSTLDTPPYLPGFDDALAIKTLCPSARHYLSRHYDLHSLYGYGMTMATNNALKKMQPGKRPFIISRSSFSGSGHYGFHWLGDNNADYTNLRYSISGIMNANMFGFSMVGSDICGFMGTTNEELCVRWTQLGAFYPFMRNHNTLGAPDQDPANPDFSDTARAAMKQAIVLRYSLLPYLYTLLDFSNTDGTGVVRPLFFQYPHDVDTYDNDAQFLWGSALLISPVLEEGVYTVDAYIPQDVWYDYFTGERLAVYGTVTLDAPIDTINVHIRGGEIVPSQRPMITTYLSRQQPFSLTVALPANHGRATGHLFWDDGESEASTGTLGNHIDFLAQQVNAVIGGMSIDKGGPMLYQTSMILDSVRVMGLPQKPSNVTINGQPAMFTWDPEFNVMFVLNINTDMYVLPISFVWKMS